MYIVGPVSCIFSVTWLAGDSKEPTHKEYGTEFLVLWCGLVSWVGASHRVNLKYDAPFSLAQNCQPRKIAMTMAYKTTV